MSEINNGPESEPTSNDDASSKELGASETDERENRSRRTRSSHRDGERFRHTRISAVWAAVFVAVLFGVGLVDFIAQNTRNVRVNFFSVSGRMPGAVALLAAALAGAIVVLAVGVCRVAQLRLNMRRQRRHLASESGVSKDDGDRLVDQGGEDSSGRP
jgi:uncharacterized integral membrane protein